MNNTAACSKRTRNPGYGHVRSYCRKKLQRTAAAAAAAVSIRAGMPSCSMGLQGHLLDTPARYLQAGFQHQKGSKGVWFALRVPPRDPGNRVATLQKM